MVEIDKNGKWHCPVQGCEYWVGPFFPDENGNVALHIVDHLSKHVADPNYRLSLCPIDAKECTYEKCTRPARECPYYE